MKGELMTISDILKYTMMLTNTRSQKCAAVLGLSPQNFGQRLKRDTLNLEQLSTALSECGATLRVEVNQGPETLLCFDSSEE